MSDEAKKRVLLAEDDEAIRTGLADALSVEGYEVTACEDGTAADAAIADFAAKGALPDLCLLDVMMPGMSGFDLCRKIRAAHPQVAVILLTAKGSELDKVLGLELGADDYVTKPFALAELLARIRAVLRRSVRAPQTAQGGAPARTPFAFGAAKVDPVRYTVATPSGAEEKLSPTMMKLVEAFRASPGVPLSRDALLNAAWGSSYYGTTRTLDQHVSALRKLVERDPSAPVHIVTRHGIGYEYR